MRGGRGEVVGSGTYLYISLTDALAWVRVRCYGRKILRLFVHFCFIVSVLQGRGEGVNRWESGFFFLYLVDLFNIK